MKTESISTILSEKNACFKRRPTLKTVDTIIRDSFFMDEFRDSKLKLALLYGSIPRNKSTVYSDVDIEMYTKKGEYSENCFSSAGFFVTVFKCPWNEFIEDLNDPITNLWYRGGLPDARVLYDSDGKQYAKAMKLAFEASFDVSSLDPSFRRILEYRRKILSAVKSKKETYLLHCKHELIRSVLEYGHLARGTPIISEESLYSFTQLSDLRLKKSLTRLSSSNNFETLKSVLRDVLEQMVNSYEKY